MKNDELFCNLLLNNTKDVIDNDDGSNIEHSAYIDEDGTQEMQRIILESYLFGKRESNESSDFKYDEWKWIRESLPLDSIKTKVNNFIEQTHRKKIEEMDKQVYKTQFAKHVRSEYMALLRSIMHCKVSIGNKGSIDPDLYQNNKGRNSCILCQMVYHIFKWKLRNEECICVRINNSYHLTYLFMHTDIWLTSFEKSIAKLLDKSFGANVIKDDYTSICPDIYGGREITVPRDLIRLLTSYLLPSDDHIALSPSVISVIKDESLQGIFPTDKMRLDFFNQQTKNNINGNCCVRCTKKTSFNFVSGEVSVNGPYLATVEVSQQIHRQNTSLSTESVKDIDKKMKEGNIYRRAGELLLLPLSDQVRNLTHLYQQPTAKKTSLPPSIPELPEFSPPMGPQEMDIDDNNNKNKNKNYVSGSISSSRVTKKANTLKSKPKTKPKNKSIYKISTNLSLPIIESIPKDIFASRLRKKPFKKIPKTLKNFTIPQTNLIVCSHCGKEFGTDSDACAEHRKYCDYPPDIRKCLNICDVCFQAFTTVQSLYRHKKDGKYCAKGKGKGKIKGKVTKKEENIESETEKGRRKVKGKGKIKGKVSKKEEDTDSEEDDEEDMETESENIDDQDQTPGIKSEESSSEDETDDSDEDDEEDTDEGVIDLISD